MLLDYPQSKKLLWVIFVPIYLLLKGLIMGRFVRLNQAFIQRVTKEAKAEHRSVPAQIEFYYNLARLAEQYEDLQISMVKSLMVSTKEDADIEFEFHK